MECIFESAHHLFKHFHGTRCMTADDQVAMSAGGTHVRQRRNIVTCMHPVSLGKDPSATNLAQLGTHLHNGTSPHLVTHRNQAESFWNTLRAGRVRRERIGTQRRTAGLVIGVSMHASLDSSGLQICDCSAPHAAHFVSNTVTVKLLCRCSRIWGLGAASTIVRLVVQAPAQDALTCKDC